MYTLYILHSKNLDRYYVGYTNDLTRRLSEHNRVKGKFTDVGIPWNLVYSKSFSTKKETTLRSFLMPDNISATPINIATCASCPQACMTPQSFPL